MPPRRPTRLLVSACILLGMGGMAAANASRVENFLFLAQDESHNSDHLIRRDDIAGVQVVYSWKQLEPTAGHYDFSAIETDLKYMDGLHKKLFIQVQDRFFEPGARNVPPYLLTEPQFNGGLAPQIDRPGENQPLVQGWIAMQWNIEVRRQFQKLLQALAAKFDGRVYGVNLPETAADIDNKHRAVGFTCDGYFDAELDNLKQARAAFSRSVVVQYVNFWPCEWQNDHHYMSRLFEYASTHDVGLGNPDIVPGRKAQMKNSYPFFHQYKGKLSMVAMAVQEPTLTYTNPATHKRFTRQEIEDFADCYLGVNIIFWSVQAPWLR